MLHEMWNINKHRVLYPDKPYGSGYGRPSDMWDITPDIEPVEDRWIFNPNRPLEDGAKISLIRFPRSGPLPKLKMKVGGYLPIQIRSGKGQGPIKTRFEDAFAAVQRLVLEAEALPTAAGFQR